MKSSDACFAAADIIATRGHCKYIEEDSSGRVCLVGALNIALCGNAFRNRAGLSGVEIAHLSNQVLAILGTGREILALEQDTWDSIVLSNFRQQGFIMFSLSVSMQNAPIHWNNLPGTSGEDVILLLKRMGTALAETE